MKISKIAFVAALTMVAFLFGCQEIVEPKENTSNDKPAVLADQVYHPAPSPICSSFEYFKLINEANGSEIITDCGPFPCPDPAPKWGDVEMFNTDLALYLNVTLAYGWYVEECRSFVGPASELGMSSNGIPQVANSWDLQVVDPLENRPQIRIPFTSIGSTCFDFTSRLSVVRLNFFTGVDEMSRTFLWMQKPASGAIVNSWCIASCGPVLSDVTGGSCNGCDAEATVTFIDCDTVDVSSCKDLSNVVLVYTDCTHEKFDGLSNKTGTFYGAGANAGKEISHVYVKSGCFKSGEGPGYGRRFDGPCVEASCGAPASSTGGSTGGNGGGKGKGKNK